jgi:hypothetical protein
MYRCLKENVENYSLDLGDILHGDRHEWSLAAA